MSKRITITIPDEGETWKCKATGHKCTVEDVSMETIYYTWQHAVSASVGRRAPTLQFCQEFKKVRTKQ